MHEARDEPATPFSANPSYMGAGRGRGPLPGGAGLYQLLVDSVRDYAIFALDADGHVLSWNAGAERLKGYVADEIIGRHFSIFYPPERVAERFPQHELEVAAREGRFEDEGWRLRKDGSRFWANVVITALRESDDALVGFAKVTRDLTERRAAEEQRVADATRVAAAEAANRAKAEFLATMSHELRTPLNAIGGYADLIALGIDGPVTDVQREHLGRIRASQQHLLRIIADLLNYSRIEAGQVTYDPVPVAVCDVVATVCTMIEPQAAAKGLRVEPGEHDATLVARADRGRSEQIVLNLLSNAVKFTPRGGRVAVSSGRVDDRVVITVTDTGPGIPAAKQAAVFEPFVQLGGGHASGHEGTGLGLAISRDLARAMGGDLTLKSVEGEGAAFSLHLLPAR